ncbi:MAG TPA: tRNA-uridine aminocarboxypropyltransferase [Polyangiaceae bacterium]|nr:tRNA-uridine aminocarboxypropyltransferase [Polyangiaceae bacterium]
MALSELAASPTRTLTRALLAAQAQSAVPSASPARHRDTCFRCFRPKSLCYCALLPQLHNRTPVLIVQHPRERFHPFGTARLLELGLLNSRVEIDHGGRLRRSGALQFESGAALLYPGPGARNLEDIPAGDRPKQLVMIDGTWHHAHTLLRDVKDLQLLPRVQLRLSTPSRYRIRAEPREECLSSVEATVRALQCIEPQTQGFNELLQAFEQIIDRQIVFLQKPQNARHNTRVRPKEQRKFPRALLADEHKLVVCYGESLPCGENRKQAFQWVAQRLASGEMFDCLLDPPQILPHPLAVYLQHMGIAPEALPSAIKPSLFAERWRKFCKGDDIVIAYNQSSLDLLSGLGAKALKSAVLKAVYFNLGRKHGSLDQIAERERLTAAPVDARGRAAQRVANAAALTRFLRRELAKV